MRMGAPMGKYVVDEKGRPLGVVVPMRRYRQLVEAMEELEDVRAYDRAKARKDKLIPLDELLAEMEPPPRTRAKHARLTPS